MKEDFDQQPSLPMNVSDHSIFDHRFTCCDSQQKSNNDSRNIDIKLDDKKNPICADFYEEKFRSLLTIFSKVIRNNLSFAQMQNNRRRTFQKP